MNTETVGSKPSFQRMEASADILGHFFSPVLDLTPEIGDMNNVLGMITALPVPSHAPLQTWGEFLGVWKHHDPEADSLCMLLLIGNPAVSPKGKVDFSRSQTAPHMAMVILPLHVL